MSGASTADIHISMLGGFSVAVAGQQVDGHWRLRKAKTLVKLLALAPGHRLHRDVVVEVLWPDAGPPVAANNLHQLLHSVRRTIGPSSIALVDDVVRLCPAGRLTVDVDLFEQEAVAARREADIAALKHALLLWTGTLLPEDLYADWAAVHRERLIETHASVAALLGSRLAAAGEHESALALLEPLASVRPRDEQLHRALIDALAGCGRRWDAIDVFERLRDALDEAYAAEPEPQTTALYQRLLVGGTPTRRLPPPGARDRIGPALETLVGRRQEWQGLRSAWQRACSGESRLFLISGEAGIGKTRLAEQLLIRTAGEGGATARTRSYSTDGRLALAPLTEWLRSDAIRPSLGPLAEEWLTEAARLLPELLSEQPQLRRPEPLTDPGQSRHFHEALSRAILTAPQPLLLLIDDLQWCDPGTLQWLQFLLRFDPTKRLLVIGTVRAEELMPGRPVTQWILGLRSAGDVTELELEPLNTADTAQLAAQVVRRDLDERSASQLYDETAGNPLYVVEMASAGLGQGARQRWGGGRDLATPRFAAADLPPRMHAVIAGRLAQLTPDALELAGLAAAVGRGFTAEILREASGIDRASMTESLDELCHRRIVRATPHDSFDFSHDKIRDVAYAELSPTKRRYLHLSIAQALMRLDAADLDPVSAELAAQYERAGEAVQAIPFYERAAEVAQRVYAHEESIGLIERGLELIGNQRDQARREQQELSLLRLLSMALVGTHGYDAPEVLGTLSRWRSLNEQLHTPPDPPLMRALAIASLNARNFTQAEALGEQLLRLADDQGDPILLVEAHYVQGVTLFWTGSFVTSRMHLEQALAQYDPSSELIRNPASNKSRNRSPIRTDSRVCELGGASFAAARRGRRSLGTARTRASLGATTVGLRCLSGILLGGASRHDEYLDNEDSQGRTGLGWRFPPGAAGTCTRSRLCEIGGVGASLRKGDWRVYSQWSVVYSMGRTVSAWGKGVPRRNLCPQSVGCVESTSRGLGRKSAVDYRAAHCERFAVLGFINICLGLGWSSRFALRGLLGGDDRAQHDTTRRLHRSSFSLELRSDGGARQRLGGRPVTTER